MNEDLDPWWADGARRALEALASTGRPFTADDLRQAPYALPSPSSPAQWGGVFQAAVHAGLIVPAGYTQSRTPSRHGAITRVWIGAPDVEVAA